jgi:hypothetical protein
MGLDRAGADAFESRTSAEFEVAFVDQVGSASQMLLASCWGQPFESFRPVRSFSSHRGKRSFSGLWWFSRTGHHVGYESWLERDHLMVLDADAQVVAVASQPFWLSWSVGNRRVRHAPDFFVRFSDGSVAVVDVRPDDRIEPDDAAKFAASAQACASVGWGYRRLGGLPPLLAANMRWLSGYRHPRCHDLVLTAALLETFAGRSPLMPGAAMVGDPIAVLPVLFHLLWRGRLLADLTAPLGSDTEVRTADGSG